MVDKERYITVSLMLLAIASVVFARLSPSAAWATVWDNTQWTLAFGLSAWLAWRGVRHSSLVDRPVKYALFAGAGLIFLGQLVWMLQVASGLNPFPAPADAVFLLASLTWIVGWIAVVVVNFPRERLLATLIDIGGALSALLAATLTLYLPLQSDMGLSSLLVLVMYPVLFLLAAGLSALVVPALKLQGNRSHWLVLAGTTGYGLSWMHWNLLALENALVPGSLFNITFTVSAFLFGLGARHISIEPNATTDSWSQRAMTLLPLVAMTLALVTLIVLFIRFDHASGTAQQVIFACCLLALFLAALRQTLVVDLLERLRHAEMAILKNEEQLHRLANFDALTGLPNRHLFDDRLQQALREAGIRQERIAVLIIDLDHFNQVNDAFGHLYGDKLLSEVAIRLQSALSPDATLARMGGDEFMLLLEWAESRTAIAALSQTLLDTLAHPWADDLSGKHFISASIGISLFPDDAHNAIELVRNADSALNVAKSSGRGTYRFYLESYTEITRRKLDLRSRLHLAQPDTDFHLVYQPQYDRCRQLVGLEVLLRWTVDGQSVPPDEFIPIAEESSLIVPIGEWVFGATCRQIVTWRAQGFQVPHVSVNVSARQLVETNLTERLCAIAQVSGISPCDLILEVTESQLLDDRMLPSVEALHAAGFTLSMDDFGTGQSSLVKLKLLPIKELKIDKAFVKDIGYDPGDREICATIHALAATLKLEIVAEGVETQEQFDLLVGMGCQRFQGWYFAPALPPSEVPLIKSSIDNPL